MQRVPAALLALLTPPPGAEHPRLRFPGQVAEAKVKVMPQSLRAARLLCARREGTGPSAVHEPGRGAFPRSPPRGLTGAWSRARAGCVGRTVGSRGAQCILGGVGSQCGLSFQACRYGHVQHLEHLLFYGADMGAQNASGNTALHICALYNQVSEPGPGRADAWRGERPAPAASPRLSRMGALIMDI